MILFSARSWVFATRTFVALLLTLYVAFSLNLEKPYWAAMTVYIVSQPQTGGLRSKSIYRFIGTLIGAAVSVVLVPTLVDAPELLALMLALWVGLCLYISLLDRTPRSYVFMLAGYTAAFIGFPAVTDPAGIFGSAVSRVEEIGIAIVITTMIGSLVFPVSIAPLLNGCLDRWSRDTHHWTEAALGGDAASRGLMAADIAEADRLAGNLVYDPSGLSRAGRQFGDLRARMLLFLPTLSSIGDHVRELGRLPGGVSPAMRRLLDNMLAWNRTGHGSGEDARRLHRETFDLMPVLTSTPAWRDVLTSALLLRLREAIELMQDCRALRRYLAGGASGPVPHLRHAVTRAGRAQHVDHGMAALSALAAVLAVLACCAAWIALGWPAGAMAVQMAAVACSFFAAMDDPVPMIRNFTWQAIIGLLIAIAYVYAILPAASSFEMLALALAPVYLLAGLMMTSPRFYFWGLGTAVNTAVMMGLQGRYTADMAATLNSGIAVVTGMSIAAMLTALLRSVGAGWIARRIMRANRTDLVALARLRDIGARMAAAQRNRLADAMLDRLVLLAPRLAAVGQNPRQAAERALVELRLGLNLIDVPRFRRGLPDSCAGSITRMLADLDRHFAGLARHGDMPAPGPLLAGLDASIAAVGGMPAGHRQVRLLLALVGVRRNLFPGAAPPDFFVSMPAAPLPAAPALAAPALAAPVPATSAA